MSDNYNAKVIKVHFTTHPDPEVTRLKVAIYNGLEFVVGLGETNPLMLLLPAGCEVSEQFATANDLVRRKNEDGHPAGGMLEQNRRVKAIRLRGVRSEGLLMPLTSLAFAGDINALNEGDSFEEFNGVPVAKRFVPKYASNGPRNQQKKKVKSYPTFVEHDSTDNLRHHLHDIKDGDLLTLTLKMHGTCVTADTMIKMAGGSRKKMREVKIGDIVASVRSINGTTVTDKFSIPDDTKKWLKLKIDSVRGDKNNLICTSDHLIDTPNGWVSAGSLSVGDFVNVAGSEWELTPELKEVIKGLALGDGSLCLKNSVIRSPYSIEDFSWAVSWSHKKDHSEYSDYIAEWFGNSVNTTSKMLTSGFGSPIYSRQTLSSRTISSEFEKYSDRSNGSRKVWLPDDFSLSSLSLAIIYMDDGSLSHNDAQNDRAVFNSCSIGETERNRKLFSSAMSELGLIGTWRTTKTRDKEYWKFFLNTESSNSMFNMILPYVVPCMQYKLPLEYRGYNITYPTTLLSKKEITVRRCVLDIKNAPNTTCWDITTETHDFIANNVVVHNSGRTGNLYVEDVTEHKLSIWDRLRRRPKTTVTSGYKLLTGSRRVVIDDDPEKNRTSYYGDDSFRLEATERIAHAVGKNEIWFYEIVGWLPNSSTPIMSKVSTSPVKDKDFTKKYGKQMVYKYGCPEGTFDIYVYRIAVVNPDGVLHDLSWNRVKAKCVAAGIKHVPQVESIKYDTHQFFVDLPLLAHDGPDGVYYERDNEAYDKLSADLELLIDGPDQVDPSHIREGIVVRVDSAKGNTSFYKLKSFTFLLMEQAVADDVVDIEEVS